MGEIDWTFLAQFNEMMIQTWSPVAQSRDHGIYSGTNPASHELIQLLEGLAL